jgi:hypothetical protein
MKTYRELLNELPEDVREAAIKNAEDEGEDIDRVNEDIQTPTDALAAAFVWALTPEGDEYWEKVFEDNGGVWSEEIINHSI